MPSPQLLAYCAGLRVRRSNREFGFGLSYVLPVLVGLLEPAGTLCLIENTEAHR